MTALLLRMSIGLGLAFALAGSARAQQAFSEGMDVWIDGHPVANAPKVLVGASRCQSGVVYSFHASYPHAARGSIDHLEAWATSGTDVDCSRAANRAEGRSVSAPCWFLGMESTVTTDLQFSLDALRLFRDDSREVGERCPDLPGEPFTLFLVPVSNPTFSNPSRPDEPIGGVPIHQATFTLRDAPVEPPAHVGARWIADELQVTWERPSDDSDRSRYYAFWDLSVRADRSCSDSALHEGDEPPAPDDALLVRTGGTHGAKSTLLALDALDVAPGQRVAVAVVHQDALGEPSVLSEVQCVARGRVDRAASTEGEHDERGACQLIARGARALPSLAWLGLLAGGLGLRRTRRTDGPRQER